MKYPLIAGLIFACAGIASPQIVYDNTNGNAEVKFGKEVVALGAVPVKPALSSFSHPKLGVLYLVEFSRGDSCPSQYLALLRSSGYRNLGEVGNCNSVRVNMNLADSIRLEFEGTDMPGTLRKKLSVDISADGISPPR